MAKAKTKAKPKIADLTESVPVRLVVDASRETPTYYANHVEIAINKHEIALWVARIPTKPGRDEMALAEMTGEIVIDAEMQILLPPTLIDGLISALETTKTNFETAFGPIRESKE